MRNSKGELLTPLDAALFKGNRGCAKYIQLHGGVPATKLTDKHALQKALTKYVSQNFWMINQNFVFFEALLLSHTIFIYFLNLGH